MKNLTGFVINHLNDDTTRLILDRGKYPLIDMDLAVACIESRRKLKGKIQEWYDEPELIFPVRLSAEQCSSSATGRYKAEVAEGIMERSLDFARDDKEGTRDDKEGTRDDKEGNRDDKEGNRDDKEGNRDDKEGNRDDKEGNRDDGWSIMDLTGGLGVDSWFFSQKAAKVYYCEMQEPLCHAANHNFQILNAENIEVNNIQVTSESCRQLLMQHKPDIVYIDPARRGEGGKKVFLIEDCTPDVLTLKDEIFRHVRHILIKLSPMADITMVCQRLGSTCREVHVVATGGECKELLIWMDREWNDEADIIAAEIQSNNLIATFPFRINEEKSEGQGGMSIPPHYSSESILFEPGKAMMKAAPFNLIASRFGICKLGRSTHFYMTDNLEKAEELKLYGKVFRIIESLPLDKRSIKEVGKKYPKAEVTARNIPMDTDTFRKKLGVTSGDDAHIFGLKSDTKGNLLIVAQRL